MLLGHYDLEHYPGVPRVSAYKYASKNGEKIIEETKLSCRRFFGIHLFWALKSIFDLLSCSTAAYIMSQ